MEFYTKAFIHVNLNTATREEILLIPGAGRRMTIEFPEYRPGYYAVFFEDPDRLKLEIVHIPPAPPA